MFFGLSDTGPYANLTETQRFPGSEELVVAR